MIALGVQIGAPKEAGWEDPIGLLSDCHRRIERFLGVLRLVARHDASFPLHEEARQATEAALHYFNTSGILHTTDEENSLFPRLRQALRRSQESESALRLLEDEHRSAEKLHETAGKLAAKWITAPLNKEEAKELRASLEALTQLYSEHIRYEDTVLFPAARRLLDAEEIGAIGAELKIRRAPAAIA
jgi:hemerythrin-like domain-containing protein